MANRIVVAAVALLLSCVAEAAAYNGALMNKIYNESSYVVFIHSALGSKHGIGTGILMELPASGESIILTNNHVVAGAERIWVLFPGENAMSEVRIMGTDPAIDIALLRIPRLPSGIKHAQLGDSSRLREGDEVYALGHPFGVRSVTAGNITALEAETWHYIVSQTPLNPGNSGGPLFNANHEVVAINTAIGRAASLVNFSVPINYVKRLLGRLTREIVVRHGDVDFVFSDSRAIPPRFFEQVGVPYPPPPRSILVVKVMPGSFSSAAGIRPGDFLLKLNGQEIASARALNMRLFFNHRPGEDVVLTVQRNSQVFERRITLSDYWEIRQKNGQQQ